MTERPSQALQKLRERADAILRARGIKPKHHCDDDEATKLREELSTFQVELEIQNEELRQSNNLLESSRQDYFRLFDLAPTALVTLDAKGRVLAANSECTALLALEHHRLLGSAFITYVHKSYQPEFTRLLMLIQSGRGKVSLELHVLAEGKPVQVRVDGVFLPPSLEQKERCLLSLVNLTEEKRLERKLYESLRELREADRMKNQFLSTISHEIRTPLTSIIGFLELMSREERSSSDSERLEIITEGSKHLLSIVNSTLDLSAIEAGELVLRPALFSPLSLVGELESLLGESAQKYGVTLLFETAEDIPRRVFGDKARIRQCLLNLLSNGIKFSISGGRVSLITSYRIGHLVFVVEDEGVGISSELQEDIFRPYKRGDQSYTQDREGTGLGLSIVKRLVEKMKGNIFVASAPGEGSKFTLQVPAPSGTTSKDGARIRAAGEFRLEQGSTVLVVDDNRNVLRLLGDFLKALDCPFVTARDGKEALTLLSNRGDVGIVLMDMRMPGMDGRETVRRIRANPDFDRIPVIAVSGQALHHEVEQCLALGCDGHVPKPLRLADLSNLLGRTPQF